MTLSCVFASIRTSPRKRKDPPARNFKIPSNKAAHKSNVPSVDLMDDIPDNPEQWMPFVYLLWMPFVYLFLGK